MEATLYLREVRQKSFRTYRFIAENSVAVKSKTAELVQSKQPLTTCNENLRTTQTTALIFENLFLTESPFHPSLMSHLSWR